MPKGQTKNRKRRKTKFIHNRHTAGSDTRMDDYMMVRNVPADLREDFKKECRDRGYSMAGKIRSFMRQFLKGDIL